MSAAIQTDFERFALDHKAHTHCSGCGGCLVDPAFWVQGFKPVWCIDCARKIAEQCDKTGAPRPWAKGWGP